MVSLELGGEDVPEWLVWIFIVFGIIFVLKVIWEVLFFFIPCFTCDKNLAKRYGVNTWALVTGATDGIGKGFVNQLAARGFNIVLVSRNPEKLEAVAKETAGLHGVQTKVIVADFNEAPLDPVGFHERIVAEAAIVDISIVVNNVGYAAIGKGTFTSIPEQDIIAQLAVNLWPQTYLTYYFLPILKARKNRSLIINLSSTAANCPLPGASLYASTKAYNDYLSRVISSENSNIDCFSLRPGYVSTPLTKNRALDTATISADKCASTCLQYVTCYQYSSCYWSHRLTGWTMRNVPRFIFNPMAHKRITETM